MEAEKLTHKLKRKMLLKDINRRLQARITYFSTDALHLSKLGSQSAYASEGGEFLPPAVPPLHLLEIEERIN